MTTSKTLSQKEKELKEFVRLTWESVRHNPEYRQDYVRFLQNYGLTPEALKPQKREGGTHLNPRHPGGRGKGTLTLKHAVLCGRRSNPIRSAATFLT